MTDKCPECDNDFIELYTVMEQVSTTWDISGTYTSHNFYGYWCKFCEKMFVKKSKSWFEPWRMSDG
jgi:hypothetical protein